MLANSPTHGVKHLLVRHRIARKKIKFRFVRDPPQCFTGMVGLVVTVHSSRPAAERVSSPVATSRSNLLSPPRSPRVLSGKVLPFVSPRGFSGKEIPGVAKAAHNKNGGDGKKKVGDACKEVGDVKAAIPTALKADRANRENRTSKDKLPGVGGVCKKIVPTVSLADLSA